MSTYVLFAWVVELVDTPDLKSCGPKDRAGSTPVPGTERASQFEKLFFCFKEFLK